MMMINGGDFIYSPKIVDLHKELKWIMILHIIHHHFVCILIADDLAHYV